MGIKQEANKIQKAIIEYANAYQNLQYWQNDSDLIPIGDQKTGCIGEFYVYLYLSNKYPNAILRYGSHSEKGWDIEVKRSDNCFKVQVKTVSEYSTTRSMSPIHDGWDELHVLYLSKEFAPLGFWIVRDKSVVKKGGVLKSRKCPIPNQYRTGSIDIPFGDNLVEELNKALEVIT